MALPIGTSEPAMDRLLARSAGFIEAYWKPLLGALCIATALLAGAVASGRPLEHDEIFTFWTARQSSLRAVYTALLEHADNHPPVDYWVRHASMQLVGSSELGLRLPSVLAFAGCMLAVFAVARRHWGAMAGFVAVAVLLASQASSSAYYGRAYGLILLWTALGLFFWRMAAGNRHRGVALAGLAVLFAGAVCLHYYAPFHMLAIVVAEAARTWQRRKIDWIVWGVFGCGVLGLPLILPLLPYARSFSKGFWTPVTLRAALETYTNLFFYGMPAFYGMLVAWTCLQGRRKRSSGAAGTAPSEFVPELAAAIYLLLLPFVILAIARLGTGAFQAKYCISAAIGVALLLAYATRQSAMLQWAALASILIFALATLGMKALAAGREGGPRERSRAIYALARETPLPVVIDAAQTFLESAHYAAPEVRERLFFLIDMEAALRVHHETTDLTAFPGLTRVFPARAVQRQDFIRQHPHFILLYEGGWVLQRLLEDHPRVTVRYFQQMPVFEMDMR